MMKNLTFYSVQVGVILLCAASLMRCDTIESLISDPPNPWELAHERCSELPEVEAAGCHLAVSIAHDACAQGIGHVTCDGADPSLCVAVNEMLEALCYKGDVQ